MVDFHSHILPGIDDGSACVEESISMLRMEGEQGIRMVAATSHFYAGHDTPEAFLERRTRAEELLRTEMAKHRDLPKIVPGAEVSFFRGMSHSEFLAQLTIGGGNCLLIEMPPAPWPEEFYRELSAIWETQHIVPVIAHIDRYIRPFRTFDIPRRLAQMPVLVQANADFFLKRRTASVAMKMLNADQIQLLGSDCHNMSARKPNVGPASDRIREKLGGDGLERISEYEHRIININSLTIQRMEW